MYIKGGSRRAIKFWAKHLEDVKTNDRVELIEKRGLAADGLKEMLMEMQENAELTRCENFMYIASFSPALGEVLTDEQWDRAYEIFEQERGIPEGQPRIIYEHEKEGRIHRHVVWDRIDQEKQKAFADGFNLKACDAAEKRIEAELDLTRTPSYLNRDPEADPLKRNPKSWETFRGMKSGIDAVAVKAQVTAIFRESENAAEFVEGLEYCGYRLCSGNRRDLVILDQAGEAHSLARRLEGVNTKELKAFMEGYDRASLPTVTQATQQLRDRIKTLEPEKEAPAPAEPARAQEKAMPEGMRGTPAHIWQAAHDGDSPKAIEAALAQKGIRLSIVQKEEAERSRDDAAAAKEHGQYAPIYRESEIVAVNDRGYVYRLSQRTTGTDFQAMQRYLRTLDTANFQGIDATRQAITDEQRQRRNEKAWSTQAPTQQPVSTSPALHFGNAATQAAQPEAAPVMPDNVRGTNAAIWHAYNVRVWQREETGSTVRFMDMGNIKANVSIPEKAYVPVELKGNRDPQQFAAALRERNIELAKVTPQEAERSAKEAEHWKAHGEKRPVYQAGELVAVNRRGDVYQLTKHNTGQSREDVQNFLQKADFKDLKGIDATKDVMQTRATERDKQRQATRDKWDAIRAKNARTLRSNHRQLGGKEGRTVLKRGIRQGLSIIGGGLSSFVRAFESLFSPPVALTRQQAAIVRDENQRNADAADKKAAAQSRWMAYADEYEQTAAKFDAQAREAQQKDEQHKRLQRDRGEGRERER